MRAANAARYWATAVKLSIRNGYPYSARQCLRDNVLYIIQHPESHTLWTAATSQIATSARAHTHTHTHIQQRLIFELALFRSSIRLLMPPDDQHSTGRIFHGYSHFKITRTVHTSGVKDRLRYAFPAVIIEMDTTIKLRSKLCNKEKMSVLR